MTRKTILSTLTLTALLGLVGLAPSLAASHKAATDVERPCPSKGQCCPPKACGCKSTHGCCHQPQ